MQEHIKIFKKKLKNLKKNKDILNKNLKQQKYNDEKNSTKYFSEREIRYGQINKQQDTQQ